MRIKSVVLSGILISTLGIFPANTIQAQETKMPMELDGSEWLVNMVYVTEKGKKVSDEDTLIFKDKKFVSKSFEKDGFEPTNYSLTLEDDEVTTRFGTMQIKGKETAFWKGEIRGETIDGSVHMKYANGNNRTTYFTGKITSGILKPKVDEQSVSPEPEPAVPAVTTTETSGSEQSGVTQESETGGQVPEVSQPAATQEDVVEPVVTEENQQPDAGERNAETKKKGWF